ncbi:MAG: hypothetical protein M0R80_25670 [Proteobacteria bacterium]|jgi:hypothetical protein|nr:hypothetical protein [Pseudomonadota bacterium]
MKTNELTNGQYFKQEVGVGRKIDLPTMNIIVYFHQERTWSYASNDECEPLTFDEAILETVQNCIKYPQPVEPIPENTVKLHQLSNRHFCIDVEVGQVCRKLSLGVNNTILVYFDDGPEPVFVSVRCSIGNWKVIPISLQQGLLHIIEQTCK